LENPEYKNKGTNRILDMFTGAKPPPYFAISATQAALSCRENETPTPTYKELARRFDLSLNSLYCAASQKKKQRQTFCVTCRQPI
jgi:hypothetical protein